jgi:hypothetical protein
MADDEVPLAEPEGVNAGSSEAKPTGKPGTRLEKPAGPSTPQVAQDPGPSGENTGQGPGLKLAAGEGEQMTGNTNPEEAAADGYGAPARPTVIRVHVAGDEAEVLIRVNDSLEELVSCTHRDDGWYRIGAGA